MRVLIIVIGRCVTIVNKTPLNDMKLISLNAEFATLTRKDVSFINPFLKGM